MFVSAVPIERDTVMIKPAKKSVRLLRGVGMAGHLSHSERGIR